MSKLKQQFISMLEMQDRMNCKVHPQWVEQGYAYYRALWLECGELIDHYGYKWWKKQQPEMEQVRLEVVDVWHFGLSMLLDGRAVADIASLMMAELEAGNSEALGVLEATEALAGETLVNKTFSVAKFWVLLQSVDMNADDLYRSYVGKNVLNFFRQDNGYKDGSYVKQWAGREDNEHLVEILNDIDPAVVDFDKQVYQALQQRYTSLIAS